MQSINRWRSTQVHLETFSLMDDAKDSMDEEEEEEEEAESNKNEKNDKNQNKMSSIEEEEGSCNLREEWKCASCKQIYASMWPKCPGCLRNDPHFVYFVDE